MNMSLLFLIPLLPLLGFAINGLAYPKLPKQIAGIIGTIPPLVAFALSLQLFLNFDGQAQILPIADWIKVGSLEIPFAFQIDQLSILMLLVITGVGTLIHVYSIGYMSHDTGFGKFFAFLNLFVFFMLILVLGANFTVLFIGWEGVGLCSYLLIGFWNQKNSYGDAARKAFIMNRVGDLGFLVGIFLLIQDFGTTDYQTIFTAIQSGDYTTDLSIIAVCLFIGAMGKSAQIPLFTWLPDAMAGPTPVSALIHAATMVTAGIYMVIRANALFELSPEVLHFVGWIGLATALLGAAIGLFQNDIKKVLAYSTVSQLGYMFMGLGASAYTASFFHVMTHAFFKALLFLGAGSVIHAMSDEQDIRRMGGLKSKMPITFITFMLGTIAIAGIPPFAGFFSKDEILASLYHHDPVMWGLAILGSALTSFYMFRVFILTFYGEFRGTEKQAHHLHESPITMTLPLIILAVFSVGGGLINLPHFAGGNEFLAHWLAPLLPEAGEAGEVNFLSLEGGAPLLAAFLPAFLAIYVFGMQKSVPSEDAEISGIQKVIYHKFYIDELYDMLFVKPIAFLSNFFFQVIDFLVIDLFVEGLGRFVKYASSEFRRAQTGNVGIYLFCMVAAIVVILFVSLKSTILQ
ncbi:NADH-quinone oxidoreductase subunit L [Aquirufa antheringensis]|uniref:NADH-quinone oxidoreductase subunit L n=2 Tax=Aquirufa antheringensis TaxID=2516559 RepID=A0A4Q9BGX1_9BACT|nr:NADH-quinone oxidoreductase subunit L [Aquirufa antheringensis]MCZ2485239.1 NADH-quinone oxidoreductase subunit L [Aquirufa antheringensis]MCZ2487424.1 NADH-quinone oxidoreductase subunit L [Aquirufa antheringensis]MCZ2490388.1 NADH-quinone oxidoreductase subunit L [Aquirufa antheringensis]TBH75540.1 NADH-quinone oxidoreductase subunit L [Aquirufa antheringensis]